MLYLIIFILISVLSLLNLLFKDGITLYVPLVVLVALAAFRSTNVGSDTATYAKFYSYARNDIFVGNDFERGYLFLQNTLASLSAPLWLFFGVIAIISLFAVMKNYREYTTLPAFAFLYYFSRFYLNRDLNQIRSGVASSLVLFSIKYLEEKNFYKFIMVILIAAQFHTAAYVMVLVYPLHALMRRLKQGLLFYVVMLIIATGISLKLSSVLTAFFSILGRGSVYIEYDGYVDGQGFSNPVLILQVVLSLIAVFMYYHNDDHINEERLSVISVYMLSTLVLLSLNQFTVLAGRLSTVLATVEPIILIGISKRFVPKFLVPELIIFASMVILIVIYFNTGQIQKYFEPYIFSYVN